MSVFDIGTGVRWREAILLLDGLARYPDSLTAVEVRELDYLAPRWALTMLAVVASGLGAKESVVKKILPKKRPRKMSEVDKRAEARALIESMKQYGIDEDIDNVFAMLE